MSSVSIRPATLSDLPGIHAIYSHYVHNSVLTFLIHEPPLSYIAGIYNSTRSRGLPFYVAHIDQLRESKEKIIGYACASPFRGNLLGYASTVELTLFIHPEHQSQGFEDDPTREVRYEADGGQGARVKTLLAIMAVDIDGKAKGMGLRDWYVQRGFTEVGRLKEVGFKKGRWIDVIQLQYTLH
ncbi:hypothetical protein D8B26_004967 [Coccidioides posadasii str. Silveira]|uniref:GNAT family N-acetyltransferase n=1 Tax=Coccidioides posadasii (strain RMSCC 757 / Silveira) TaxID=443226 RepID=E9D5C3_COCPS|nr:GNAT family N-acetyltransferase [Coccidioides posadasii str. Silveira]QVM10307.1 hypothetical protein D8B26_004967 [Coccidioides posadasii str. Silveira]